MSYRSAGRKSLRFAPVCTILRIETFTLSVTVSIPASCECNLARVPHVLFDITVYQYG